MSGNESSPLFWRQSASILYGNTHYSEGQINRLVGTGIISEWVMQYFQRAKEQNKTKEEEVRADLNGRLKKLRKLQSEKILNNDFEKKLVRNEFHQIQNLLT
jgi:acetyl-CoA carboxylase alpha subunit